jgi:hypothetical protein
MTASFREAWANPPEFANGSAGPATVAAPHPAVPPGTIETWVMSGGWGTFPQVSPGGVPELLRIFDLRAPGEIIRVTDSRTAAWQVVRGDQGTAPLDHAAGFAVYNAVTAAGLSSLAQGVESGFGVVLPDAAPRTYPPAGLWKDALPHDVAWLEVPPGEAQPGAVYEALAWGWYHTNGFTLQTFYVGMNWGGVNTGGAVLAYCPMTTAGGWNVPANNVARWRLHGLVNIFTGSRAGANLILTISDRGNAVPVPDNTNLPRTFMAGQPGPVIIAADMPAGQRFRIWAQQTLNGGGQEFACQGGKAWKAA